jgi:Flp pilus assembly pilin Flp
MKNLVQKFVKEEEGSIVEYLILIAVAGIIAAFLFPGLRGSIVNWFNAMVSNVTNGINGSAGSVNTGVGNTL